MVQHGPSRGSWHGFEHGLTRYQNQMEQMCRIAPTEVPLLGCSCCWCKRWIQKPPKLSKRWWNTFFHAKATRHLKWHACSYNVLSNYFWTFAFKCMHKPLINMLEVATTKGWKVIQRNRLKNAGFWLRSPPGKMIQITWRKKGGSVIHI